MQIHDELEALGSALLVKRTKVLYAAVALMLFGALGMVVQASESASAVGVVSPALSDACKDYNFRDGHADACGAANQNTPTSTPSPEVPAPLGPGSSSVLAGTIPFMLANH